jgi:hypothetical protein
MRFDDHDQVFIYIVCSTGLREKKTRTTDPMPQYAILYIHKKAEIFV